MILLEANVRVDEEGSAEDGVGGWVERSRGERSNGQRDESGGH